MRPSVHPQARCRAAAAGQAAAGQAFGAGAARGAIAAEGEGLEAAHTHNSAGPTEVASCVSRGLAAGAACQRSQRPGLHWGRQWTPDPRGSVAHCLDLASALRSTLLPALLASPLALLAASLASCLAPLAALLALSPALLAASLTLSPASLAFFSASLVMSLALSPAQGRPRVRRRCRPGCGCLCLPACGRPLWLRAGSVPRPAYTRAGRQLRAPLPAARLGLPAPAALVLGPCEPALALGVLADQAAVGGWG